MEKLVGLLPRFFEGEAYRDRVLGVRACLEIRGQVLRGSSESAQGVREQAAVATVLGRLRHLRSAGQRGALQVDSRGRRPRRRVRQLHLQRQRGVCHGVCPGSRVSGAGGL